MDPMKYLKLLQVEQFKLNVIILRKLFVLDMSVRKSRRMIKILCMGRKCHEEHLLRHKSWPKHKFIHKSSYRYVRIIFAGTFTKSHLRTTKYKTKTWKKNIQKLTQKTKQETTTYLNVVLFFVGERLEKVN